MSVGLNTFLRKALANKNKVDIGQFHLLNLDAIKEKVGDHWPQMRAKIFEASTHFIEKRIGNDDVMVSCEEGFLIIFCENDADPQDEIARIGEELQAFFLGEPDMKDVKVAGEAKSVSARELAQIAAPGKDVAPAKPTTAPVRTPDADTPAAPANIRPSGEESPARALQAATEEIEIHPTAKAFFQPIWDAATASINSNLCHSKVYVEGRLINGRRAIDTRMTDLEHFELDMASVKGTIEAFLMVFQKKKKASFCQTVHYTTLADPDLRAQFLAPLDALPRAVRRAFMIRIDEFPAEDPTARAFLDQFRDMGFTNCVEVPFGTTDLDLFDPHEIKIFGCKTRPPSNMDSEGLLDHDITALRNLTKAARSQGALTYLEDTRDLKTLKEAMSAGLRFFSGKSIYPEHHRPMPNSALSMVDLCRRAKAA